MWIFLRVILHRLPLNAFDSPQVGRKASAKQTRARTAGVGSLARNIFGCRPEALRTEHYEMNHMKMIPDHNHDGFFDMMDSCPDRLNASCPPEGPIDRQYEDIL